MLLHTLIISCAFLGLCLAQSKYTEGPWRKSLDGEGACWTDKSCKRVLTCAHGGEWNITFPYDSMPAYEQAYIDEADAVKGGDFNYQYGI